MIKLLFFLFFLPIAGHQLMAFDFEQRGSIGYQHAHFNSNSFNGAQKMRVFVKHQNKFSLYNDWGETFMKWNIRAFQDFEREHGEFNIREWTLNNRGRYHFFNWGPQILSFSETFGVNIMEVANPVDYAEGPFEDLVWQRRSVTIFQQGLNFGDSRFITYYAPIARHSKFPDFRSAYDPIPSSLDGLSRGSEKRYLLYDDSEFGARIEHLFSFGLDLSLMYYRHYNRVPFYTLTPAQLELVEEKISSYGASFSQSIGNIILRGDFLFNPDVNQSTSTLSTFRDDRKQLILGVDYTTVDQLTFGGQYHQDSYESRKWVSGQVRKTIMNNFLELGVWAFRGLGNDDIWVRPDIKFSFSNGIKWRTFYDFIDGNNNEALAPFNEADRIQTEFSFHF